MKDLEIERITVYVVGPETERHAWASDMHAQFMTNTILRAQTRGGLEGVAGFASFSSVGALPDHREALWHKLVKRATPRSAQAQSAIDILMWDLAAKAVGLPLYRYLGACRESDGRVTVSNSPGLGVEVDWAAIEAATISSFEEAGRH